MSSITAEQGSGNVYRDFGMENANEMLEKAQLVNSISARIH
jgi:predicted XRE-type DNA-binding protein